MIHVTPDRAPELRALFLPERRHLIGLHAINTGHGTCYVDRWPQPRAIMTVIGSLCALSGDPGAVGPEDIREHTSGLMHCPRAFLPLLEKVYPDVRGIDRIVLELDGSPAWSEPPGVVLRRLGAGDAEHLAQMPPDLHWIGSSWGGLRDLAASGYAWGAFADGRIASLAVTFLLADSLEDIGVVTGSDYRGRGLASLCAAALCQDVKSRGRIASWTTSQDNPASVRVAEKLGFKVVGPDILYVLGKAAPAQ